MHDQLKDLRAIVTSRAFVIPDYQRGYAWSDEHRRDPLTDLGDLDALDAKKKHFTGTLVLRRGPHEPRTVRGRVIDVLEVVDGQQRLTTLVILLSVMARRLDAFGTEAAQDLARDLRETLIAFQRIPRLTPHGDAAQFFFDHVLGDQPNAAPSSPTARALLAARTQFELVKNSLLFAAAKVTRDEPLARLVAEVNRTWTEGVRLFRSGGGRRDGRVVAAPNTPLPRALSPAERGRGLGVGLGSAASTDGRAVDRTATPSVRSTTAATTRSSLALRGALSLAPRGRGRAAAGCWGPRRPSPHVSLHRCESAAPRRARILRDARDRCVRGEP